MMDAHSLLGFVAIAGPLSICGLVVHEHVEQRRLDRLRSKLRGVIA